MERPLGVTIIAVLTLINALASLGLGVISLSTAGFFGPMFGFALAIAGVNILIGVIYLLLTWGLWVGRGWAWTITMILTILNLFVSIILVLAIVGIFPLIICILILYCLTRPNVKAFFGKGAVPAPTPPPAGPPPPP